MARKETNLANSCNLVISEYGGRVRRNNVGYDREKKMSYGLGVGSSDFIGWMPVSDRAVILAVEYKTPGVRTTVPVERLDLVTDELWEQILSTNLVGMFRCCKAAAPALKASKGSIVNLASIGAFKGSGSASSMAYAAAKAGVVNMTRNLARALGPEVRVNAIAPGSVDSPWLEWTDQQRKGSLEKSLLKKIGKPSEYADVIVFLGFGTELMTGETVIVDAGLTLG